jgi:hypothetical protein
MSALLSDSKIRRARANMSGVFTGIGNAERGMTAPRAIDY